MSDAERYGLIHEQDHCLLMVLVYKIINFPHNNYVFLNSRQKSLKKILKKYKIGTHKPNLLFQKTFFKFSKIAMTWTRSSWIRILTILTKSAGPDAPVPS